MSPIFTKPLPHASSFPHEPSVAAGGPRRGGGAIVVRFVAIFLVLQVLYVATPNAALERVIIHHALAQPTAWVVNTLNIAEVQAVANEVRGATGVLSIIRGCDGSSSMFLLIAAIAAFHARCRRKLHGLLFGLMLLHVLNIARVAGLFALLRTDMQWFYAAHEFIAPTVTVMVTCLFYTGWCVLALRDAEPRQRTLHEL